MGQPIKGTESMLADHKMIRKLLKDLNPENPRYPQLLVTTSRVVAGHAWFEDELFFPAIDRSPMLARRFTDELYREHQDIEAMMKLIAKTPVSERKLLDGYLMQFNAVMDAHFAKEEDALFPMAERILDSEGLNKLGDEMRRRAHESRAV